MENVEGIAGLVREAYGLKPLALESVGNDPTGERLSYRVKLDDGRILMLRGCRADSRMPFWYGGGAGEDWLADRARLLVWLAERSFPAPRVVSAPSGAAVVTYAGYCVLLLTYLPGQPLPIDAPHLRRLASVLGQLHGLAGASDTTLPASWWFPVEGATRPLLDALAAANAVTPPQWQSVRAAFTATLMAAQERADLPHAAIHGDGYPANALQLEDERVALIDWDCAGWGPAILDLGTALLDAHPDGGAGERIVVDPAIVKAMVAGYVQFRTPTSAERDYLLDAMRFGVSFLGAVRFAWAAERGWSEQIERSLVRLQARYRVAEDVAQVAREAMIELLDRPREVPPV
jgi:Ser/Thr protein kinase RdoA (MazF antagonist)